MKKALLILTPAALLAATAIQYILYQKLLEADSCAEQFRAEAASLRLHLQKNDRWDEQPQWSNFNNENGVK